MFALIAWTSLISLVGILRASMFDKEADTLLSFIEVLMYEGPKIPISAFANSYKRKVCQTMRAVLP